MHENFAKVIKPKSAEAELLAQIDLVASARTYRGDYGRQRTLGESSAENREFSGIGKARNQCVRFWTLAPVLQIKAVTLYAFSTENWKRPEDEVSGLMQMLKLYLKKELKTVHKNNIRFQAIGKIEGLSDGFAKTTCRRRRNIRRKIRERF